MSTTSKRKHSYSFICILFVITSYMIIVSFFISSNFIWNKIRTKSKIKFSNKIITISLFTNKITFFINIIYCNISMINTFFKKIYRVIICIFINNNYISNKCPYISKKSLEYHDKQQDKYLNYFHLYYNYLIHNGHHLYYHYQYYVQQSNKFVQ